MIAGADLSLREHEGCPVASLSGEIDIANAAEVRGRLLSSLSNAFPGLVLDLSGLTYVDSQGVQLILELAERMRVRRLRFRIVMPDRSVVKRILVLTHVDQVAPIDETLEDALRRIRADWEDPEDGSSSWTSDRSSAESVR
jgi:anti-sigma B factor antagonist